MLVALTLKFPLDVKYQGETYDTYAKQRFHNETLVGAVILSIRNLSRVQHGHVVECSGNYMEVDVLMTDPEFQRERTSPRLTC